MIWRRKQKVNSGVEPAPAPAEQATQTPAAVPAGQLHGESKAQPEVTPEIEQPTPPELPAQVNEPLRRRPKVVTGARVAWVLAMSSIGAAIGGVIILGIKFIDSPVEGSTTKTVLSAQASASPTPGINQLTGMYIELMYPGVFDQVGPVKNDAQALEQFNMGSKQDSARMIAVSVRNLPENSLNEESGYRYRTLRPAEYVPKTDKIRGETVTIMMKRDKTEATLFWPRGNKVAIVSITSTSPKDDVSAFMAVIQKDIRWRQ